MIDVSKLTQKERWKLGFAIAAAGNLDGEDNATNEYFYSGVFGRKNVDGEEDVVVPSYQEMKQMFKEFFGFDYDDVWAVDTLCPLGRD